MRNLQVSSPSSLLPNRTRLSSSRANCTESFCTWLENCSNAHNESHRSMSRSLSAETSWKERMSKDKCIHELFQEQADRNPDAVAVVCEDRELSYRDLNRRSNQLAQYLRELGIGPEKLAAICLARSPELLV